MSPSLAKAVLPPGHTSTALFRLQVASMGVYRWGHFPPACQFYCHPSNFALKRLSQGSVISRNVSSPSFHGNTHTNPTSPGGASCASEPGVRWGLSNPVERLLPRCGGRPNAGSSVEPVRDCSKGRDKGFHSRNKHLSQ